MSQLSIAKRSLLDREKLSLAVLFLGERDLHGIRLRDFKALQCIPSSASLHLILKLHKSDVVTTWNQTYLFEPGEPGQETTRSDSL